MVSPGKRTFSLVLSGKAYDELTQLCCVTRKCGGSSRREKMNAISAAEQLVGLGELLFNAVDKDYRNIQPEDKSEETRVWSVIRARKKAASAFTSYLFPQEDRGYRERDLREQFLQKTFTLATEWKRLSCQTRNGTQSEDHATRFLAEFHT